MKKSGSTEGQSASELIDKKITELGDWRGETLSRMRKLIKEAEPDVVEEWKWMGTPVWSQDGIICTGESYKSIVKLTFAKGASLKDPAKLFNSSLDWNTRRAIDIPEGEEVDAAPFKALIRAAVALRTGICDSLSISRGLVRRASGGSSSALKENTTMATNTIRLHRVLRTSPDRLYRAFVEPSAFERWLPPFGFTGKVHSMEPVVGGVWRMSFTNFGTGHSHSFGGKYLELVPGQRVAYDAAFDDPNLPGTMKTTVTLTAVSCGTEMSVVQEGIPDVIPAEMCYLGWQESLVALAQLVEDKNDQ